MQQICNTYAICALLKFAAATARFGQTLRNPHNSATLAGEARGVLLVAITLERAHTYVHKFVLQVYLQQQIV